MGKYFGADGVRGIANKELALELTFKLGRHGGYMLSQHGDSSGKSRVLVDRDTRISGEMLEQALIAGLLPVGIEASQLGVISTSGVTYPTRLQKASAGVMISASHNPAEDSGIKFSEADSFKLVDDQEAEIEALLDAEEDTLPRPSAEGSGSLDEFPGGLLKYSQFLAQSIPGDLADIIVCLGAVNGATVIAVNRVLVDLETDSYITGTSPNGLNINDGVGSTYPEALAEMVVEKGVDVGLAFDGDGDRIIAADELGRIIDGDKIMYICVKYLAEKKCLKKDIIATTVTSNLGFHKAVEEIGLKDVVTQVDGHYVVEEMCKNDYSFGDEQSGYMIFLDYDTIGDGMFSGIQLLNVVKQTGKKLPELADEVTIYPQKLVNIRVTDKNGAMEVPAIKAVAEQAEAEMNGEGCTLVRPSGTESLLRVMAEVPTQEKVDYYVDKIVEAVCAETGVE